jgi:hypothetical protein
MPKLNRIKADNAKKIESIKEHVELSEGESEQQLPPIICL